MSLITRRGQTENTGLRLKVKTEPANEAVTKAEYYLWTKIDTSADDNLTASLITSIRKQIETMAQMTFVTTVYQAQWDTYAEEIPLPMGPHQSVDSVKRIYQDTSTTLTESTDYFVRGNNHLSVFPNSVYSTRGRNAYGVLIEFTAGFGDLASTVPEWIKEAIKRQFTESYDHRDAQGSELRSKILTTEVKNIVRANTHNPGF